MDLSPQNFISIDIILADVLSVVDDSSFKLRSKGWYTSQVQQALEEISFDTYFREINKSFPIPDNLRLELPKGAFNLREVYIFNGDDCDIRSKANVWTKERFINSKSGNGYVARDSWGNQGDIFYRNRSFDRNVDTRRVHPTNQLYFCGMQDGVLMLSESCRGARERIMLVYNGTLCDIGEAPFIPSFFRQYVKDWVSLQALKAKMTDKVGTNEYAHWAGMMNTTKNDLENIYEGSAVKAERRAKTLNQKERQDLKEYWLKMNY